VGSHFEVEFFVSFGHLFRLILSKNKTMPEPSPSSNYRPYNEFDDTVSQNSADSSITSTSGSLFSGSGSTWSLPRSRGGGGQPRRASDGPRRSGSSFRVSMRPKGHALYRSSRTTMSSYDSNQSGRGVFRNWLRSMVGLVVMVSLLATVFRWMDPTSSDQAWTYLSTMLKSTMSTEDRVAQGEMSVMPNEIDENESQMTSLKSGRKKKDFFHIALKKNQLDFLDEISKEASDYLRGNSLTVVDQDEIKVSATLEVNVTLEIENATTVSEREDFEAIAQESIDRNNHTTVAYVLPVFKCYPLSAQKGMINNVHGLNDPSNDREFLDAILMLEASIHRNSVRNPSSGSSYDYHMIALMHPGVVRCAGGTNRTELLQRIGFRVLLVREPIREAQIQDDYLRNHAPRNNGPRSGMRDMIRLHAFRLVEYRIAVLVDTTTFLSRPADAILDTLLNGPHGHEWAESHPNHIVRETFYANGTVSSAERLPREVDIMFTRDYSSMEQNSWTTGMSLAFVPIRPAMSTYNKLINKYQSTIYDAKYGWDKKGYAHYAGSMQTKGLLTYFFSELEPHRKMELHRCIYNNLADVPFIAGKKGKPDNCRDVKEHKLQPDGTPMSCTDCRLQPLGEIVVFNFNICRPPWVCPYIPDTGRVPLLGPTLKMCRHFHESWFRLRQQVEEEMFQKAERVKATGTFHPDIFHGYCQPGGVSGGSYVPINFSIKLPGGFGQLEFPKASGSNS
jgi:hypothetical protein